METSNLNFSLTFPKEFTDLYNEYAQDQFKLNFLEIEGIAPDNLDIAKMSKSFFTKKVSDISIDANANANEVGNSNPNSYANEVTKGILKLEGYYLIWRQLEKDYGVDRACHLMRRIWDGDLYVHDASGSLIQTYYCYAYSTNKIMKEGMPWDSLESLPPKTAKTFLGQVSETTIEMSQQQAGAVAISDIIVNYAWYAKNENLSDQAIANDFQSFIHLVNRKLRVSSQSPFTNISLFCKNNLKELFGNYIYPDYSQPDFEYVAHVQEVFLKFFSKGDPKSKLPYRFPVVTVSILVDEKNGYPLDRNFLNMVSENVYSNGCVNVYVSNEVGKLASCCRLVNDFKMLSTDSFGNGGTNIGSHRVVTVNYHAIALQSNKSKDKYKELLNETLIDARDILSAHRRILHKRSESGFIPFITRDYINIDKNLFSTIGVNAISEAVHTITGSAIHESQEAEDFASDIIKQSRDFTLKCIDEFKVPFNLEQVPAESLAPKNAKKDFLRYGNSQPYQIYSNQFIPLWEDVDVYDRMKLDGKFSKIMTGGSITHINLSAELASPEDFYKLVTTAIELGVEHFAVNYSYNICESGHVTKGSNKSCMCPLCSKKIKDQLTRVIGYFVPVSSWNKVRRENEFPKRYFH